MVRRIPVERLRPKPGCSVIKRFRLRPKPGCSVIKRFRLRPKPGCSVIKKLSGQQPSPIPK